MLPGSRRLPVESRRTWQSTKLGGLPSRLKTFPVTLLNDPGSAELRLSASVQRSSPMSLLTRKAWPSGVKVAPLWADALAALSESAAARRIVSRFIERALRKRDSRGMVVLKEPAPTNGTTADLGVAPAQRSLHRSQFSGAPRRRS